MTVQGTNPCSRIKGTIPAAPQPIEWKWPDIIPKEFKARALTPPDLTLARIDSLSTLTRSGSQQLI